MPPLAVPDVAEPGTAWLDALEEVPPVRLLGKRIRQHGPGIALTSGHAGPPAQVCRGLEELPLTLELVAAQVGPRSRILARCQRGTKSPTSSTSSATSR